MVKTTNCVRCFKPATIWTGHIKKGKGTIIAGWCNRCIKVKGFSGQYIRQMGRTLK